MTVYALNKLSKSYFRATVVDVQTQTEFHDIYPDFFDTISDDFVDQMSLSDDESDVTDNISNMEIYPDYEI